MAVPADPVGTKSKKAWPTTARPLAARSARARRLSWNPVPLRACGSRGGQAAELSPLDPGVSCIAGCAVRGLRGRIGGTGGHGLDEGGDHFGSLFLVEVRVHDESFCRQVP